MKKVLILLIVMSLFGHEDFFGSSHPDDFLEEAQWTPHSKGEAQGVLPEGVTVSHSREGLDKFSDDIYHEISYPIQALNHCITGIVKIGVMVYANGQVGKILIIKGLGYGIDAEVLRAFNACRQNKQEVNVEPTGSEFDFYTIEVNFMINGASPRQGGALVVDSQTFRRCSKN